MATSTRSRAARSPPVNDEACSLYKNQAFELLKTTFPLLSVACIRSVFQRLNFSFQDAHRALRDIDAIVQNRNIAEKRAAITENSPFLAAIAIIVLKSKRRRKQSNRLTSPTLLQELEEIPEVQGKQGGVIKTIGPNEGKENKPFNQQDEATLKKAPIPAATTMLPKKDELQVEHKLECECCFGEYPFEDMVACSEGSHLFCQSCLQTYVKEQLYGNNRSEFQCMSSDGCSGTYTDDMMKKALSPRLFKNVEKHTYRRIVMSGMDTLWTCPACDFVADCPTGMIFIDCPECSTSSCRLCNEISHKDQTCEEAKAEKEKANAHARMAAKMTESVVRQCPGCNTSIMKSDGCNKMTCPDPKCKTKFCYLCRQKINGYDHFCRTPHCDHSACNKCVLFPKIKEEEQDRRARREAAKEMGKELGKTAAEIGFISPEKEPDRKHPARAQGLLPAANRPVPLQRRLDRAVNAAPVGHNHRRLQAFDPYAVAVLPAAVAAMPILQNQQMGANPLPPAMPAAAPAANRLGGRQAHDPDAVPPEGRAMPVNNDQPMQAYPLPAAMPAANEPELDELMQMQEAGCCIM